MNFEPNISRRGRFYEPDDRRPVAPHRSEFVYAMDANRTGRVIGWHQSQITKVSQPYYSELERRAMRWVDLTPNVRCFSAQSEVIPFRWGLEDCKYTPDLRIELTSRAKIYLEIKPTTEALKPEVRSRLRAIKFAIHKMGAGFLLITEKDLDKEPLKSNIESLQLYRPVEPDEEMTYKIDVFLGQLGSATLGTLARLCPDPVFGRQTVMSLIYRRHLSINLNAIITDESPVRHAATA
jgi:hypothetical protein